MSIESVISEHKIENPADASLVRLAGLAASMPDANTEDLLKREHFSNPADRALAQAMVDVVRSCRPPAATAEPEPHKPVSIVPKVAAFVLCLAVLGLAVGLFFAATDASKLRSELIDERSTAAAVRTAYDQRLEALSAAQNKQMTEFQRQLAEAQTQVSTQFTTSTAKDREQTKMFTETIQKQAENIQNLQDEINRLKAELATAGPNRAPSAP